MAPAAVRSVYHPKLQELIDQAVINAQEKVVKLFSGSKLFRCNEDGNLPSFHMSDLTLGKELGRGEFCTVQSVSNIDISEHASPGPIHCEVFPNYFERGDDLSAKKKMRNHCLASTEKSEKYAVKFVRDDVKTDPTQFERGIIDLIIETQILSAISHANIIQLRGFNKQSLFQPNYFIVLDRLQTTLFQKMSDWRQAKASKNIFGKLKVKKEYKNKKMKLNVASSLCSALAYLHILKIVHRDVKPDNIGFDNQNVLKLFDFGLATELKRENRDSHGLYKLTGNTGSRRYMAPEVARGEPYSQSVDIYSVAIILWEMLSLKIAFDGYTLESHDVMVAQVGERPPIDKSWPEQIQEVIQKSWSHESKGRPSADNLHLTLITLMDTL